MKQTLPPAYLLTTIGLMIALWTLAPGPRIIPSPWNWTGVLLVAVGVGLNVAGDRQFERARTTMHPFGQPRVLVTTGVFAHSRHPMYLGMMLLVIGLAILLGYVTPFALTALLWVALNWRFIPHEERVMSNAFGQEYQEYRAHTRRWL
jgi:protein-S-isoprenylcysteine O-methyltransferase Ste14